MPFLVKMISGSLFRIIPLALGGVTLLSGKLKSLKMSDVKKYGPIIIAIIAIIFLWSFLKKKKTLSDLATAPTSKKKGYLVASAICDYLGTAKHFSWWHPAKWFEDEKPVSKLLSDNKEIIKDIEIAYKEQSGNNLMIDIEKYFDPKQKDYLSKKLGWS